MREFLSYCEFSNGWIAIDVDKGHGKLLAALPFFFQGKKALGIKNVEEWRWYIFSKVEYTEICRSGVSQRNVWGEGYWRIIEK